MAETLSFNALPQKELPLFFTLQPCATREMLSKGDPGYS
jgi:hypothetical protein